MTSATHRAHGLIGGQVALSILVERELSLLTPETKLRRIIIFNLAFHDTSQQGFYISLQLASRHARPLR